jgi:hypothetical protein
VFLNTSDLTVFDDLLDAFLNLVFVTSGDTSVLMLGLSVFEYSLGTYSSNNSSDSLSVMPDNPRWMVGDTEQVLVEFLLDLFSSLDKDSLVDSSLGDSQFSVSSDLSQSLSLSDDESLSDSLSIFLSSHGLLLGNLNMTNDSVFFGDLSLSDSFVNNSLFDDQISLYVTSTDLTSAYLTSAYLTTAYLVCGSSSVILSNLGDLWSGDLSSSSMSLNGTN